MGAALWAETWGDFMRQFSAAIQPYAHYGRSLAQWQTRLHFIREEPAGGGQAIVEFRPRAYDPQKATRITMFHGLITYVLGRVWLATDTDSDFGDLIEQLGRALGCSRYLDGHRTDWGQQFWAFLWENGGNTILE